MQSYEALAEAYDLLTQDIDYTQWANYILEAVKRTGTEVPSKGYIVDVACGSGSLALELARLGYDMVGVDHSESMIAKATEKARQQGLHVTFTVQDMRTFQLPRKADLAVCTLDGLNYLLNDGDMGTFFKTVNNRLKPQGKFIFDINTKHKLMQIMNGNQFFDDRDDLCCLWAGRYDEMIPGVVMDITLFVKTGELFKRFDEEHIERIYTVDEICQELVAAGFSVLAQYDELSFNPAQKSSMRIHFIAQKKGDCEKK